MSTENKESTDSVEQARLDSAGGGGVTPSQVSSQLEFPSHVFVKGGTSTMAHDQMIAEQEADAERRRREQDFIRHVAETPLEEGGGKLYENKLAPNPEGLPIESAKVELLYLTAGGEQEYNRGDPLKCLADVIVGLSPLMPTELTLVLVCPRCETKMPQGQCQIQVRQSNRKWYLDTRKAGELIVWIETGSDGQKITTPYRSAGVVMECERFTCPRCNWSARIDNNKVRPDR